MTASAPEPISAVPMTERGYANDLTHGGAGWWGGLRHEKTPELIWPACLDVYDEMSDQDAQVSSVLRAVITPITRTAWRVDGTGCRSEVTAHIAADLGLPIVGEGNQVNPVRTRGRFSWTEHLGVALEDYLVFGHAYFEQLYRVGPEGMFHLRKLGYRPPRTISKITVARDGGLVSIDQRGGPAGIVRPSSGSTSVTLPVARLVAYVHRRKGANWVGKSLLRPAYKFWLLKDRDLRTNSQANTRNGMGIPKYKAASTSPAEVAAGRQIASDVRAGDEAGVSVPLGADLELMGVTGDLPDILASIKYYDEQIARAVLAHFLNLGSQTGSWALGSTFADFFTLSLQAVAEDIRDTTTKHVIEDLVDANWGPDEPAPRLVFDEIGSRRDAVITAVAGLVSAGVLKADEDLEQFLRTVLGLPPRDADSPPTVPADDDPSSEEIAA